MEKTKENTLVLDYSKWRCGAYNESNKLGDGTTSLENERGFMCCLGQFTPQLIADKSKKLNLLNKMKPHSLECEIKLLTVQGENYTQDTLLSKRAMEINDCTESSPQLKIEQLKALFLEEGYYIDVINQPN